MFVLCDLISVTCLTILGVFCLCFLTCLLVLVSLLLHADLLAKFIFSFCFVPPVLWKGLNCHPDGRNPLENPNWGNPRVEKRKLKKKITTINMLRDILVRQVSYSKF